MRRQEQLPLGVVLERRRIDNPWQDYAWKPVAVIPGAATMDPQGDWAVLSAGEDWAQFHAGTLPLQLFRKETEGYKVNLSQHPPRVFVGLRSGADMESRHDLVPFLVTACPYEAQDYLDSGDDVVEPVAMPEGVIAFVQAYIDQHHVDEPFHKRKRKRHESGDESFGRRAPGDAPRGPGAVGRRGTGRHD